jgi:hypothetical protein
MSRPLPPLATLAQPIMSLAETAKKTPVFPSFLRYEP